MAKPTMPPLFVDIDVGNSIVKMKIHGLLHNLTVFPHALKYLNPTQWKQKKQLPITSQVRNTRVIQVDGQAASIGALAETDGKLDRLTGEAKFVRKYYGLMFVSGLLDLLPNGHDNLQLFAGYSPLDQNAIEQLQDALGGKHTVELLDGTSVTYVVRSVRTYAEPIGGFMNWLLAPGNEDVDRGRVLIVDIGGKISSLVTANTDAEIEEPEGIDLGIQDIMADLQTLLKANHRDWFTGMKTLPEDRRKEALATGYYRGGGEFLNVQEDVFAAAGTLLTRVEQYFSGLGGKRNFDYIIVTGGGGGLMSDQLDKIFQHPQTHLAAPLDLMHCANLFGAERMLKLQLTASTKETRRRVGIGRV